MKLVCDTSFINPILEISTEVAVRLEEASFYNPSIELRWNDFGIPGYRKLFGMSNISRNFEFERIMRDKGVSVVSNPELPLDKILFIKSWANSFHGGIEDLKLYKFQEANLGCGVASSIISKYRSSQLRIDKISEVREALYSCAIVYERTRLTIKKLGVKLIYLFNGRFAYQNAIKYAALNCNIDARYYERGSTFDKYEIFNKQPHIFEYIRSRVKKFPIASVHNDLKSGHDFFIKKRMGASIGWHSFSRDQKRSLSVKYTNNKKTKIVYFSSSDDEFAAIDDDSNKFYWGNQMEAITKIIKLIQEYDNYSLVIRLHPHLLIKSTYDISLWLGLKKKYNHVTFVDPGSKIDSYALLDDADFVISYGSMIGLESAYWGKKSILVGDSIYNDPDICSYPKNPKELLHILRNKDDPIDLIKTQDRAIVYGNYFYNFGIKYAFYSPSSFLNGVFNGESQKVNKINIALSKLLVKLRLRKYFYDARFFILKLMA